MRSRPVAALGRREDRVYPKTPEGKMELKQRNGEQRRDAEVTTKSDGENTERTPMRFEKQIRKLTGD
jgi:hypothetical protein